MDDNIICIAFKGIVDFALFHPLVEGMMQIQVGK
jgi:hypothetical protein